MKLKRGSRLWLTVGGVLLVLGLLAVTGAFRPTKPIPPEKIVTAERGDVARSVVARGKIEPLSRVGIKSKANGIIKALLADVGEPVKEGQVLADLDKEDLEAQVREAKASHDAEEANLQAAVATEARARIEAVNPELGFTRRDYERAQGLFKDKIASQQQLDDAERAYEVSRNKQQLLDASVQCAAAQTQQCRARVAAAKAGVDRAEENLGYATIRSPITGVVLQRWNEVGDAVSSLLNLGSAASVIMVLGDTRVKRAVGAKRRRILTEFFLEANVLTLLSGILGVAVALMVCSAVNRMPLPTLFSGLPVTPVTACAAFATLVVVGILSAIYPARRAAWLEPVEALRHE